MGSTISYLSRFATSDYQCCTPLFRCCFRLSAPSSELELGATPTEHRKVCSLSPRLRQFFVLTPFHRASFLVDDVKHIRSTSWSSVEEDETTYDWTYEHISVLTEARLVLSSGVSGGFH